MTNKKHVVDQKTKIQKSSKKKEAIGYSGNVKVSLVRGNTVIKSVKYHNRGCKTLFRFLCSCLAGDFNYASRFRPSRLRLYSNKNAIENESPFITRTRFDSGDFSGLVPLTGYISIDTFPTINVSQENGVSTFNTKFHFLIPNSYLIANDNKDAAIYQVMLFPTEAGRKLDTYGNSETDVSGVCAYYLFTVMNNQKEEWAPIKLSELDSNTNLVIEWEMTIKNI